MEHDGVENERIKDGVRCEIYKVSGRVWKYVRGDVRRWRGMDVCRWAMTIHRAA